MRTRRLALVGGIVALLLAQGAAAPAGARSHTYKPPYHKGSQGGDFANLVYSDPSSGWVGVVRAYPVFNPFGCPSNGGFVTLRVLHRVTAPVPSVEVDYSNAMIDQYSFLTVGVKEEDRYLGSKEVRGPIEGSGRVLVPLVLGKATRGSTLRIDFGVEVSSACPNVDAAMAQFDRVVVRGA
jgi:hypothetical protein